MFFLFSIVKKIDFKKNPNKSKKTKQNKIAQSTRANITSLNFGNSE